MKFIQSALDHNKLCNDLDVVVVTKYKFNFVLLQCLNLFARWYSTNVHVHGVSNCDCQVFSLCKIGIEKS